MWLYCRNEAGNPFLVNLDAVATIGLLNNGSDTSVAVYYFNKELQVVASKVGEVKALKMMTTITTALTNSKNLEESLIDLTCG